MSSLRAHHCAYRWTKLYVYPLESRLNVIAWSMHCIDMCQLMQAALCTLRRDAYTHAKTIRLRTPRRQVGWIDARACGVSQLCWQACGAPEGGGHHGAGTQLLLAAGAADGSIELFCQTATKLAQAVGAAPHGAVLYRWGMAVQPDMRAVTCLAVTERDVSSAQSPGMEPFPCQWRDPCSTCTVYTQRVIYTHSQGMLLDVIIAYDVRHCGWSTSSWGLSCRRT